MHRILHLEEPHICSSNPILSAVSFINQDENWNISQSSRFLFFSSYAGKTFVSQKAIQI